MRNGIKYFRSVVIFGVLWLRDVFGFCVAVIKVYGIGFSEKVILTKI